VSKDINTDTSKGSNVGESTATPTSVDGINSDKGRLKVGAQNGVSAQTLVDVEGLNEQEQIMLADLFAVAEEHLTELGQQIEREKIQKAFVFALKRHSGQFRKSGDEFIIHPVGVAKICAGMRLDMDTICAALLHDTVEDTSTSLEEIEQEFGEDVARLVDGVTKLSGITFQSRDEAQAENFRKMIVAMANDIRVILIKFADRLHNMRTIDALPKQKRIEKAKETLDVYAPLAHRLGIHAIKWELEDLAFAALHPRKYQEIKGLVSQQRSDREEYVKEAGQILAQELKESGIDAKIAGRAKHFYSIYAKMTRRGREFNEIYDLTALRVIVDSMSDCYGVIGAIHALWKPLPGRFKDFVAMPKANMYQSLHTSVVGPKGRPLEIQIRTTEMHRTAEYGIAAHWMYKGSQGQSGRVTADGAKSELEWVQSLATSQSELSDPKEFLDSLKVDLFEDEIFVFTPKGEVKQLPEGSTPVDFAYEVHTEIGHHCVGANVNGKLVPLHYQLKSGDIVEIQTAKRDSGPSRDWLSVVKTNRARSRIRSWLKRASRQDRERHGREVLQRHLRGQSIPHKALSGSSLLADVIQEMGFKKAEDFYIALGGEKISANTVVNKLLTKFKQGESVESPSTPADDLVSTRHRSTKRSSKQSSEYGIKVQGTEDVMTRIAKCCHPVPGDPIVGYISLGRGITVHHAECRNVADLMKHEERIIEVEWDGSAESSFKVQVEVHAWDRRALLEDISKALGEIGISIVEAYCSTTEPMVKNRFVIEVADTEVLDLAISRLRSIDSVFDAFRVTPGSG